VEEAYWFGEGVMPILRRRGVLVDDVAAAPLPDLDRVASSYTVSSAR
jgi:hypothetical protein